MACWVQVMYYFMGKMLVLQPDQDHTFVKGEPDHPMLPMGPGLYTLREPSLLSSVASGALAKAAKLGNEGAAQATKVIDAHSVQVKLMCHHRIPDSAYCRRWLGQIIFHLRVVLWCAGCKVCGQPGQDGSQRRNSPGQHRAQACQRGQGQAGRPGSHCRQSREAYC